MNEPPSPLHRNLKFAGCLIILGLLVEAMTLYWSRPLSFLGFMLIGGFLVAVGIALYLLSVLNE